MLPLHSPTLLIVAAVLCQFMAAVVLLLGRHLAQPMAGLQRWAAAAALIGISAGVNLWRLSPNPGPAVALGLPLVLAGHVLQWQALRQFEGRRTWDGPMLGAWALVSAVIVLTWSVWPNYAVRGLFSTGSISLLCGASALRLARRPGRPTPGAVVLGVALGLLSLTNAGRAVDALFNVTPPRLADLSQPSFAAYLFLTMLMLVAANIGVVLLINERMNDWVLQAARHDHLTGVLNRKALFEQARIELSRARRQASSTAAFVIDLDEFKGINDEHGHLVGDAVLRQVAWQAQRTLRCTDLIGRYGGDEFVALLPDTDLSTASAIAERLRQAVAVPAALDDPALPPVTVSIGVAALPAGTTLEALLGQADQALLQAKRGGRDRSASAPPPGAGAASQAA